MTRFTEVLHRELQHGRILIAGFTCDNCDMPSVGITKYDQNSHALAPDRQMDVTGDVGWLPQRAVGKDFPDVPAHIAAAAGEAHGCQSTGCYRAAVMVARAVIEATAKDRGITSGHLIDKIDKMHQLNLIREHVKDGAHEVRHLGNDMAHGDFVEPVAREDADLVLTLMDELLEEVFQSPARVAKAQAARQAKRQRPAVAGP